jgi:hypothetical protein
MTSQGFGMFMRGSGGASEAFAVFNRGNNTASQSAKYFLNRDVTQDFNYLTSVQRGGLAMSNSEKLISSWGFLAGNTGVTGFTLLNFADSSVANGDLLAASRNGMATSIATDGLYNTNGTTAVASALTYKYNWSSGAQAGSTNLTVVANFGAMATNATTAIACLGNAGRVTNLYTWASAAVIAGPQTPVATQTPTMCAAGNADMAIFGGSSTAPNNNKYTYANNALVAHTIALVNGSAVASASAGNETYGIFHNISNPTGSNVQNRKLSYAPDTSVNGTNFSFASNTPTAASNGIAGVTSAAA